MEIKKKYFCWTVLLREMYWNYKRPNCWQTNKFFISIPVCGIDIRKCSTFALAHGYWKLPMETVSVTQFRTNPIAMCYSGILLETITPVPAPLWYFVYREISTLCLWYVSSFLNREFKKIFKPYLLIYHSLN